ncbi:syntaxin-binding protein 4-like [Elysia marginata]|uniref:Syntaxin-binding protein 4-like n=1 Tax=Elysia marginata TaxID=1093978 RepID=A0AAV4IT19_9GAST|nr:syntaxin-binding protein 4-like [Elysia marginata]
MSLVTGYSSLQPRPTLYIDCHCDGGSVQTSGNVTSVDFRQQITSKTRPKPTIFLIAVFSRLTSRRFASSRGMSVTLTLTESPTEKNGINGESTATKAVEEEDEDEEAREAELVVFENTTHGLGLKICGGCSTDGKEDYSIFVKRVLPGGLAEASGQVQAGDQLLEVNGQNMQGITYDRAVSMLRQASLSNHVELVVARDEEARNQFEDYITQFELPVSPQHIPSDQDTVTDSDVELQRKMGSILQEAGFDLNDSADQSDYLFSGGHRDRNGHVSPTSSVSSEANQTVVAAKLPSLPRAFGNGRSAAYFKRATPTDSLNTLLSSRLSHDLGLRLHVSQLESATSSLGLEITPSTQAALRRQLTLDEDGRVTFSEFVAAARLVFRNELEPGSLLAKRPQYTTNGSTHQANNSSVPSDYVQVVRERDQLRDEVVRLREELRIRNQATQTAEDQLQFIRKQAQASIEEGRALKVKLQLAEEAHAKAQQTECDYEEVVAMLENEVAQLRLQMSKSDAVNMQKRLAVLVCQLKKADMGKKTYEVATEKLTKFVEHSLDTLSALNSSPRLPTESNKINKKKALQSLASDGREVIKTVRSLMESVPLPFGWEEAYTMEGVKYYINHLNQTTTWTHPVSCMEHQTASSPTHQQAQQQQQKTSQQHPPPSFQHPPTQETGLPPVQHRILRQKQPLTAEQQQRQQVIQQLQIQQQLQQNHQQQQSQAE